MTAATPAATEPASFLCAGPTKLEPQRREGAKASGQPSRLGAFAVFCECALRAYWEPPGVYRCYQCDGSDALPSTRVCQAQRGTVRTVMMRAYFIFAAGLAPILLVLAANAMLA